MADRVRPYLYYDAVVSICTVCYRKIDGKILFQDDKVYLVKRCPVHGYERVLVADDVDYYRRCREVFIKPPEMPDHFNTEVRWGCPYDCGLCPDHEQHSCLSIVEVTDNCNLDCPICYASSGTHRKNHRSLQHIEAMLDAVVRNEGEPDVVQISGGEPTIHPDFFAILAAARARPIRHLMVNTNGIRIATEDGFAERLAEYTTGFEIYLQFDSFERDGMLALRGADLRRIREKALDRLNALNISTTLVVTLKKGLNDHEIGKIIDFAVQQPAVNRSGPGKRRRIRIAVRDELARIVLEHHRHALAAIFDEYELTRRQLVRNTYKFDRRVALKSPASCATTGSREDIRCRSSSRILRL